MALRDWDAKREADRRRGIRLCLDLLFPNRLRCRGGFPWLLRE